MAKEAKKTEKKEGWRSRGGIIVKTLEKGGGGLFASKLLV